MSEWLRLLPDIASAPRGVEVCAIFLMAVLSVCGLFRIEIAGLLRALARRWGKPPGG